MSTITWLTFEEACAHLRIGRDAMYKLIREGAPGSKWGKEWRFPQEELGEWLLERTRREVARRLEREADRRTATTSPTQPDVRDRAPESKRTDDTTPGMYTPKNRKLMKQLRVSIPS